MNYVTFQQLDACISPAYTALKADPEKYAKAVRDAGSDAAVVQSFMATCLTQLGSPVDANQFVQCATDVAKKLKSDPQALQLAIAEAGGEQNLASFIADQCLTQLQAQLGITPPPAEKKTPWGWIIGGVAAATLLGSIVYVATREPKKQGKWSPV